MWKDEFIKNYCDYEGNYLNVFVPTNKVIEFIESLLKEARIDENELWISKCKSNPLSSQEFLVAREAFEERIKKLNAPEPTEKENKDAK